jgi:hypothetical protein
MSTVQEIERAIEALPPSDYASLLAWLDERRGAEVDAKFAEAIHAGKFDGLAAQAVREIEAGETTPLDEFLRHS